MLLLDSNRNKVFHFFLSVTATYSGAYEKLQNTDGLTKVITFPKPLFLQLFL